MLRPALDVRRSPRVPLTRFVVCLRPGDRIVGGDLSAGGVGFEVPELVHLGDAIAVSLLLPETGETMSLSAIICHAERTRRDTYRVGARFIDVDALELAPLERFVEERALEFRTAAFA